MPLLLLSQEDVERLLDPAVMLEALSQGFAELSAGKIVAPGRTGINTPDGFLGTMPGWLPGGPMGVKLVTAFHSNPARGLRGHQALICLFDPETGTPLVVMDGTHITALRTAGGATLSARLLARPDALTLAIIGGGVQGIAHASPAAGARRDRHGLVPLAGERGPGGRGCYPGAGRRHTRGGRPRRRYRLPLHECSGAAGPRQWIAPGAHVTSVGFNPPGGDSTRR